MGVLRRLDLMGELLDEPRDAYKTVSLLFSGDPGFGAGANHLRASAVERRHYLHFWYPHRFLSLISCRVARRSHRSRPANDRSVAIANNATSTAPSMTKGSLSATRPLKIGVPSVKAPTVDPIVAVPIAIVTETRIPDRMTGAARGNSTSRNCCHGERPSPAAASRTARGTPSRPATAFSMIGRRL